MSSERDDPFDIPDPFAGEAMPLPPPPALPPSPARGTVRLRRALAVAVALGLECALISAMGLRTVTTKVLLLGVLCPVLAAAVAVVLLLRTQSTSARLGLTAAAASLLFFVVTAAEAHASSAPAAAAMTCMVVTTLLLAGPLVLGALVLRHAFPSGAAGRAATLGIAAGLLGAATIRLHCPHDDSIHVMLGHGLPMVAAGLLALAAHKLLRA